MDLFFCSNPKRNDKNVIFTASPLPSVSHVLREKPKTCSQTFNVGFEKFNLCFNKKLHISHSVFSNTTKPEWLKASVFVYWCRICFLHALIQTESTSTNRGPDLENPLPIVCDDCDLPTYGVLCLEAFVRDADVSTEPEQHGGTH